MTNTRPCSSLWKRSCVSAGSAAFSSSLSAGVNTQVGEVDGDALGDGVSPGCVGDALGDVLGGHASDDQSYGHAVLAESESSISRLLQSLSERIT